MHDVLTLCATKVAFVAAFMARRITIAHASLASVSLILITVVSSYLTKLRPSSATSLNLLALKIVKEAQARALDALRARLDAGASEADSLRAGADALLALFPAAVACAVGTFAQGAGSDVLSGLECGARDEAARAALRGSLPSHVGSAAAPGANDSSVWRVCGLRGDGGPLDSAECEEGLASCADWHAAVQAGLFSSRAITLPLNAGPVLVGFLQLHFSAFADRGGGHPINDPSLMASLRELCDALAAAVFVRRAFAINRETFAVGMRAAGIPDAGAPHRRTSSPTRLARASSLPLPGGALPPLTLEADAAALATLDASLDADAALLADWGLDVWALQEEEVCRLFSAMMHATGMLRRFCISPVAFDAFIHEVACRYSSDNAFHTFRHAWTVCHVSFLFLTQSRLRETRLNDDLDALALLLSAICHDVEHGGFTNSYLVNSGSMRARLYNDASPNENHHCAVAFELMDAYGILGGLSFTDAKMFRKLAVAAILATDMACHIDLLTRVSVCLAEEAAAARGRASAPPADDDSSARRLLMTSFILHAADLSCPLLPPALSQRIAGDLSREFAAQAALERAAGMPVTVMEATTALAKAKMEIGFLGACAQRGLLCVCVQACCC
jgi:hypothetical protein